MRIGADFKSGNCNLKSEPKNYCLSASIHPICVIRLLFFYKFMTKKNFLDIVKKERGDSNYAGDQHGGAAGMSGRGLPDGFAGNFMFATGIECSYPVIKNKTHRVDELELTGHYERWREDLELVREMGIRFLRYGVPFYRINTASDRYDWSFTDEVLPVMREMNIEPILDLCHFGMPDWLGNSVVLKR